MAGSRVSSVHSLLRCEQHLGHQQLDRGPLLGVVGHPLASAQGIWIIELLARIDTIWYITNHIMRHLSLCMFVCNHGCCLLLLPNMPTLGMGDCLLRWVRMRESGWGYGVHDWPRCGGRPVLLWVLFVLCNSSHLHTQRPINLNYSYAYNAAIWSSTWAALNYSFSSDAGSLY